MGVLKPRLQRQEKHRAKGSSNPAAKPPCVIVPCMFDVLVYLYENYWRPDACPDHRQLSRKLSAVGFESDEIHDALHWLDGLAQTAQSCGASVEGDTQEGPVQVPIGTHTTHSIRLYSDAEQELLGTESIGFIAFLESAGVLPPPLREMVIDRATAVGGGPIDLDDLKIIVLMVFWSLGEEPDALVLDELCDDASDRVAH